MSSKEEIYISTDVEANGPIPGVFSMLSFASAAFNIAGDLVSTFSVNLEMLPGAREDERTMEFWSSFPAAYNKTREDTIEPSDAMIDYNLWLSEFDEKPVFVGFPGTWDFMWIAWYNVNFTDSYGPLGHSGLCAKSFACAMLKLPYRKSTKRNFPNRWFMPGLPHTHVALDDAIEQGHMFMNMFKESRHENN